MNEHRNYFVNLKADAGNSNHAASDLRSCAEEELESKASEKVLLQRDDEMPRLLHELQVHQIELEMQNRELLQARDELERSLEKYTDIYDFTPVGYFTLCLDGNISAVNLRGASYLGIERTRLLGRCFKQFVTETYRPAFTFFLGTVFANRGKEVCEVALRNESGLSLFVQIKAVAAASGQECHIALIDITSRKQGEDDLRSYTRRLIEKEEELRKKLAVELHDEIGRDLTVLGMNMVIINDSMTGDAPKKLIERIEDSGKLIEAISRTVRGIMADLRPPVLDDFGLVAALRWHAHLFSKRTGITVLVQADEAFPRMELEKETSLFRIAQEALMNASKHADTQAVTIKLRITEGKIWFTVADEGNGCLLVSSSHIQGGSGWGMKIMRERAELIGGNFHVSSAPGKGTVVSVELPLEDI